MYRSVNDVAKQVLEIVPEKTVLHVQINKFIKNLWNQAPEALFSSYNWMKFIDVLNTYGLDDTIDQSVVDKIHNIVRDN